jgi:hypothetical protein
VETHLLGRHSPWPSSPMNIPTNQGVFPKMGHRVHETPSGSARSASNGIGVSLLGPPGVAQ